MARVVTVILVLVGLINALPVVGVLGPDRLAALYGIPFDDANVLALMQHRAVLLGLVGGFLMFAAFRPDLQAAAIVLGLVSMLAFIAIVGGAGDANVALQRVALVDVVASALLLLAISLQALARKRRSVA